MSGVRSGDQQSVYRAVFDAAPVALIVIAAEGLVMTAANAAYLEVVGKSAVEIEGRHVFDVFPPSPDLTEDDVDLRALMTSVIESGTTRIVEAMRYDIPMPGGGFDVRWWSVIEVPITAPDGRVEWILHYTQDLTELIRTRGDLAEAQEQRGRAAEQVAALAEVALALAAAESVDAVQHTAVVSAGRVFGADAGVMTIRAGEDGGWRLTFADVDDSVAQLKYGELPYDSPLPGPCSARTGRAVLLPDRAAGLAFTPEMEGVYADTGRLAVACLPLVVQAETIGSLGIAWREERTLTDAELELFEGFTAQCAQALHRVRGLEAREQAASRVADLAGALQRALLTPPPSPDQLEITVRYRSALDVAQVGGDWYDAFQTADGTTVLVVGDVMGHDSTAAAAMGQVRGLLRALAYAPGATSPARTLVDLEHTAQGLHVSTLATGVLARVEAGEEPGSRRLRWSNAGHPPPVLLHPDGTVTVLGRTPDPLLGLNMELPRADHTVDLPPGSTLLMYTDGLIERRDEDIDDGIEHLVSVLAGLVQRPLDDLCDDVLEMLAPHTGDDDIALIAVRVATTVAPAHRGHDAGSVTLRDGADVVRIELPVDASAAARARELLSSHGADLAPERLYDAMVCMSEAVTNAVLHGAPPIFAGLAAHAGGLRVQVTDHGPSLPERAPKLPDECSSGGRGLVIIDQLAASWGVDVHEHQGKTVWFSV